jgi:ferredoxin-NADP reductase
MAIIPVKIAEIIQETPTVRVLKIDLHRQDFLYKPGQWIDCYADINGVCEIVGYSLASSPRLKGFIELAVKLSDNPVTMYIHEGAAVGDTLYIEGGQGDVYYEPCMGDKVVMAAAGIGVSPLMGILRIIDEATNAEVTLFQSASTFDELIYYKEIVKRTEANPRLRYVPSVTREKPPDGVGEGRITGETFEKHSVDFDSLFYLSGPEGMIPDIRDYLLCRGVDAERIKYEVWW